MVAAKTTIACWWRDRWPVWGYVGIESAQPSYVILSCLFAPLHDSLLS